MAAIKRAKEAQQLTLATTKYTLVCKNKNAAGNLSWGPMGTPFNKKFTLPTNSADDSTWVQDVSWKGTLARDQLICRNHKRATEARAGPPKFPQLVDYDDLTGSMYVPDETEETSFIVDRDGDGVADTKQAKTLLAAQLGVGLGSVPPSSHGSVGSRRSHSVAPSSHGSQQSRQHRRKHRSRSRIPGATFVGGGAHPSMHPPRVPSLDCRSRALKGVRCTE